MPGIYATLSIFLFIGVIIWFFKRPANPLPPGPKPIPFIGNIHQMPRSRPFETYREWSKIYGSVIYMHFFGRQFIILNSLEDIQELFEKRSAIYSTRPRLVMAGELVGREKTSILFTKYGPRLKKCRQLVHSWMGTPKLVQKYWPTQELRSYKLMESLIKSPKLFSEHIRNNAGSTILQLTYGIETQPLNDPYIAMSEQLSKITAKATQPGAWLVDSFPFFKYLPMWFPGAYNFQKWSKEAKKISTELVLIPYLMVQESLNQGKFKPSWTANQLLLDSKNIEKSSGGEKVTDLVCASGSLYAGGIDTVVSLLRTFFLMMARNADVQERAQEEIDKIIGTDRLSTMGDINSLPYVSCVIKELFRINPIVPLVPHSLDIDDIYKEWKIPKGTWVMANLWAVLHDPDVYRNPELFNPNRFSESNPGGPEQDPTIISFGFGRRFCPGYHFSQAPIFLNITHVLSIFTIKPPVNSSGQPIIPPSSFDVGHLSHPSPFECQIIPRNPEKIELVQLAIDTVKEN